MYCHYVAGGVLWLCAACSTCCCGPVIVEDISCSCAMPYVSCVMCHMSCHALCVMWTCVDVMSRVMYFVNKVLREFPLCVAGCTTIKVCVNLMEVDQLYTPVYTVHSEGISVHDIYSVHSEGISVHDIYSVHSEGISVHDICSVHSEGISVHDIYSVHSEGISVHDIYSVHSEGISVHDILLSA